MTKSFRAFSSQVQMVTSCPESYHNFGIARNCSFELPIKDLSLVVPVTDKRTRTTYANKYCAECHNDTNYEPWDLTVDFVEITSSFFENDQNSESAQFDLLFTLEEEVTAAESAENSTERRIHVEQVFPSVRYHSAQESFLATFDGKNFVCTFDSKMPADMAAFVRKCLSNLISECPDDEEKNELCQSYTEIVYDRHNSLSFRNKVCAECNSVPPQDASYCPQSEIATDRAADRFVISSRDKERNRNLCANPIVPRYFCPTKSN